MRPITRLMLSGDAVHAVDVNMVLELNACGRGFITAETQQDYTGKLVRLDVGYTDLVLRWFTGYVERSQPAENGYQRLFVRELAGVFDRMWPCAFQHPTLRQLADWLSEHSGLTVHLPDAGYVSQPIPHFTHSGSGHQLLANIGAAFGIDDYVWQPLPDGALYLGSWADSLLAGAPVTIPAEFSQAQAAGNSMTLPLIQSVRPGAVVNQQRLSRVQLLNENMTIEWVPVSTVTGRAAQRSPAQRQIDTAYPELSAGLHLPKFARVEAPSEAASSGNIADPFRPRYAVDLQLLDADGKPAKDTPVYPAVPLPVPMAGSEAGLFQFPPPGTLVEVGFTGGRPDKPFVRQTVASGQSLPDIKPGEQLQQQRAEVSQRVTVAGDWERKTDQAIRESSMHREVSADEELRTLVTRETLIKATDNATVLGTHTLQAGAIVQIAQGDYSLATQAGYTADVGQSVTVEVGQSLTEKIGQLRRSIAGARQELVAPVVWVGSQQVNVMTLMLDTLDVIQELATQTASHTHNNTGTPLNAGEIQQTGRRTGTLKDKYSPIIG
ncbi:hypothetical protein [Dickeya dadantii]|uniref:hypothetical protein n=1 Tax=Dickeya dadantii TaxID=204038 RepID=UPI0003A33909|nr:hypothetical protein [Dickeya dadantii]